MYAISPDGQELAYTSNIDEIEATSTNNEIFVVSMVDGASRKISTSPGADSTPLYSPDGKYLAWRSQARAGFEADKWRLFVQDRQSKKTRDLTENFDCSVGSFMIEPKAKSPLSEEPTNIWFSAEDRGEAPMFVALPESAADAKPMKLPLPGHDQADDLAPINIAPGFTQAGFFTVSSIKSPAEIWAGLEGGPKQITHMNDALLSQIDMQPLESFTFKGAN